MAAHVANVAAAAAESIPIAGRVLAAMLEVVSQKLKGHAAMKEQWMQLKEKTLPQWSDDLRKLTPRAQGAGEQLELLRGVVDEFRTFLDENTVPGKLESIFSKKTRAAFDELVSKLEDALNKTAYLMMAEVYLDMSEVAKKLEAAIKILEKLRDQGKDYQVQGAKIGEQVEQALQILKSGLSGGKGIVHIPEKQLQQELKAFDCASGAAIQEVENKLLSWVNGGAFQHEQDVLKVALALVRKGSKEAKSTALDLLERLTERSEMRNEMLQTNKTLAALSYMLRDQPSTEPKTPGCLKNLMQEPALFFEQWKRVRGDIPAEDLEGCKSAIVEAGGIEALRDIYMGTKEMTKDGIDSTDQQTIMLVIDAMAFLSTNADCRAKFAEDYHNVWPLLHFLWNSSYLSTRQEEVMGDPKEIDGELGEWYRVTGYRTVLTKFGYDRDKSKTWLRCERSAGEALWKLSLDKRCKQVLLELGTFVNSKYGTLTKLPGIRGPSFHAILGWVAIASRVREADPEIKIDTGTDICFLRIAWNLLSDQDIKPTELKAFNDDKPSDYLPDALPDSKRLPLLRRSDYDDYKRLPLLVPWIFNDGFNEYQRHCDCAGEL